MKTAVKLSFCFSLLVHFSAVSEVITDGSVGEKSNLSGQMIIPQQLGATLGNNLFHSFKTFNIQTGESATFTGSNALKNVIGRVTGGYSSFIDGSLTSTIGHADFYFINPSGVFFGPNAQVNVPAAFHVSTANTLQFTDGSQFNAANTAASSLSIAEPKSFGFLGNANSRIAIQGALISDKNVVQDFNIVAGNIVITNNSLIKANAGNIHLTAVGESNAIMSIKGAAENANGSIRINNSSLDVSGKLEIQGGDISVSKNSQLLAHNTDSQNANLEQNINITANNLSVDNSRIHANVDGIGQWSNIKVTVSDKLSVVNGGQISSGMGVEGKAVDVDINAGKILVNGQGNDRYTGIFSKPDNETIANTGNAGTVSIKGDSLTVLNGGRIQSKTYGSGNAGDVKINAGRILVDGQGHYALISSNSENKTLANAGNAGTVNIQGDNMTVVNGGQIYSDTWSSGNAGKVEIEVRKTLVNGQDDYARISSSSNNETVDNAGNAGVVNINGDSLTVLNGGEIYSDTFGAGNAGNVEINVGKILVDGQGNNTWISSDTNNVKNANAGNAGTVNIKADSLSVFQGGIISSNTYGIGDAGDIVCEVGKTLIKGNNAWLSTNTINEKNANVGNAGIINIKGDSLKVLQGGIISSSTYGTGNAGNVICDVRNVLVGGQGKNTFISSNTQNETIANAGDAGAISIKSDNLSVLNGGNITSSTWSSGNGGRINIESDSLSVLAGVKGSGLSTSAWGIGNAGDMNVNVSKILIDGQDKYAWISSETGSNGGNAGSMTISSDSLTVLNSGQISSDTFGFGDASNISITSALITLDNSHISAKAATESQGQTGNVTVTASNALLLVNQGNISIQNDATVADPTTIKAGVITVFAPGITLKDSSITSASTGNIDAGSIVANFSQRLDMDTSFMSTSATDGNGGNISINGGELINLQNSGFLTSVTGADGNGGKINVAANLLVMNTGVIQANALGGKGGDIGLNLKALIPSQDALIKGGAQVNWQSYRPGFNVIQAASATGVSGNINLTSPQLNISGVISGLDASSLVLPVIDRNPCQALGSSLTPSGKGGVPITEAEYVFVSPITVRQSLPDLNLSEKPVTSHTPKGDNQPCALLL